MPDQPAQVDPMEETILVEPTSSAETPGRLERFAHQVASSHVTAPHRQGGTRRLPALARLTQQLHDAHRQLVHSGANDLTGPSAAEWLLDNYYLVVDALRQVKQDLPAGYYRQLPKLVADPLAPEDARAGQPRVYAATHAFWTFEERHLDHGRLSRFMAAYQENQPLTIGELWAIPSMLRLASLETLAATAVRMTSQASGSEVSRLDATPTGAPAAWDEPEVVATCVTTLRRVDSQDWSRFFEGVSLVHRTLAQEPAGIYARMDDASRDRYRGVVESLASATHADEVKVARMAVELASVHVQESAVDEDRGEQTPDIAATPVVDLNTAHESHVGYYLIGPGRLALERATGYRPQGWNWLRRAMTSYPTGLFLGSIGVLTGLLIAGVVAYAGSAGGTALWQFLAALVAFVPALTVGVGLVNLMATHVLAPRILPKLDFGTGIPASCRTMVVVPCLITSEADVASLAGQLELHSLRNADPNLTFALLSDFSDAPQSEMPEDTALIASARECIEELNRRYPSRPFYLFHRRRLWNGNQNTWMGWERKRGKLQEFNQLLRGKADTSYHVQVGDLTSLSQVRYVITLDADTILPRGEANRLVGTLAHPLNRAHFDEQTGKVRAGYTVIQPRTAVKPTSANRSLYSRVFTGDRGIDLYTRAVSDVYQDLFGAGIFVGKGIYEVDSFERSLAGRVPENAILSHDLFEGVHGRVGLATDILLYEDYPPHYLVNVLRSHRWVRGDWQLLPWLRRRVPAQAGRIRNDLELIDRWKILDNLRRSLVSVALMVLLIAGWTVLPGSAWVWTLMAVLTPAIPSLVSSAIGLVKSIGAWSMKGALRPLRDEGIRWLLFIAFLPYESQLMLDAIATTVRRLFTHRNMLQWTTAEHTVRIFGDESSAARTMGKMLPSTLAVGVLALLVSVTNPASLPVAAPFLLLWLSASTIAHWISRPIEAEATTPTPADEQTLRLLARRTWLFYEHFVGPDGNWLPPDHFQESPRGVLAQRTSPTNVGLYLLTVLAAHDLGYVSMTNMAVRLYTTFSTLNGIPRYRGHFMNWIDTRTLETLSPAYVSSVDSGNLAGCLIALKQGCLAMEQRTIWRWESWQGLIDLLLLLEESLPVDMPQVDPVGNPELSASRVVAHVRDMQRRVLEVRDDRAQWLPLLTALRTDGQERMNELLASLLTARDRELSSEVLQNCRIYAERIQHHLQEMQDDVLSLLPWLTLLEEPTPRLLEANANPAIAAGWLNLRNALLTTPSLREVGEICTQGQQLAGELLVRCGEATSADPEMQRLAQEWCLHLIEQLRATQAAGEAALNSFATLADTADRLVREMDFGFLFDAQRQLFHVGYNVDSGQLDTHHYDLLASEARITSLVAIAKYDVPLSHWIHLGRPLTRADSGAEALLSWSGTMFEYLMPPLLMHSYPESLLDASARAGIDHQIAYGREKRVPWGISESGYYSFDAASNYRYNAFGVPGMGFKRGLAADLVITPYASILALCFKPTAVLENMAALRSLQMMGRYGLYEALDFTPDHLQVGQPSAIVRSYMTHHQGMIMLALVNHLQDQTMVRRFHAEPMVRSVEMLLQEHLPAAAPLRFPNEEEALPRAPAASAIAAHPWTAPRDTPFPLVHFLSNGRYGVLLSNAGSGYSSWNDLALTRWRADSTLEPWGSWLYVEDLERNVLWSATQQPLPGAPEHEETLFYPHMVSYRRREHGISLFTEVSVAPDDDVEVRRVTFVNEGDEPRRLQLTTYGEVVMAPAAADQRHPAFGKLFIESEFIPDLNALLFKRRPRSSEEQSVYMVHMLVSSPVGGPDPWGRTPYESDRAAFVGRGGNARAPAALTRRADPSATAAGSTGATLDPVMALGQEILLGGRAGVQVAALTIAAPTREAVLEIARRYRAWTTVDRVFSRAQAEAEREMRQWEVTSPMLEQMQLLLALLLYPHAGRRADANVLRSNRLGQPGLWPLGISGDYPILLVRMGDESGLELIQEALQAHAYWRRRGMATNLVIINGESSKYGQPARDSVHRLIQRTGNDTWLNQRRGIFVLQEDQMSDDERTLLLAVARVVLRGEQGTLANQMAGLLRRQPSLPLFVATLPIDDVRDAVAAVPRPVDLLFDNGTGGFDAQGEYVIYLEPGETTPAPWVNVIANDEFGCLVSEGGAGSTWAINAGENRLTPWRNDPVENAPAEAIYLRDEETAEVWSPTPQPTPAPAPYLVRHGAGYSLFAHNSHALRQQVRIFVAPDAPVKVVQVRLENSSERQRRFTVTYYAEWVLGVDRADTQAHLVSEYVEGSHALLVRNGYSSAFGERVAFLSASKQPHGLTADRAEFLGRLGSLQRPAALDRIGLDNRVEAGADPCGALQLHIDLAPGAHEEFFFLVGQGANRADAQALIEAFQAPGRVEGAWSSVQTLWEQVLGTVTVETPEPAMNLLLNRWLLYQTLACRFWGRSALYQSGGAFGFRDQLQDALALIHSRPDLVRTHLLLAARHQFEAGDVLHWWHPPDGQGVRTRISDDLLWLPYVTAHYVKATGDTTVLDEAVPFLKGPPLEQGEAERYAHFEITQENSTLYEHCLRALRKGSTAGPHGLPLMGGGDWNDGMNRVGIEGKGESVWLGWFLHATLTDFADMCAARGEASTAGELLQQAADVSVALEAHGWDGGWYRRAYYDDGTPLGSAQNAECQIDSIAQSWAVLSGAAEPERARRAMDAVVERLVKWDDGLILLFTPPFDQTEKDPGYIKGYLPGVRENGGQYTHGALWTVWALTTLGDGNGAAALFRLINPIGRADTLEKVQRYKVEPYVISADVYGVPPHAGRGGWTWYTGSASWMYRLGIEAILGVRRTGDVLFVEPCIPREWPSYTMTYRYGQTTYAIRVENPAGVNRGVMQVIVDGAQAADGGIRLLDDGQEHQVTVVLGGDST